MKTSCRGRLKPRFAIPFGMSSTSSERLYRQAFHGNAPVEFTPEQARKMLDDFALHYPDVKQWRKHMIERLKKTVPGLKDV
jgi:hypothetical protein